MLEVLHELHRDLEQDAQNSSLTKLTAASLFRSASMSIQKDEKIDYSKLPASDTLRGITRFIKMLLQNTGNSPQSNNNNSTLCFEIEVLHYLNTFNIPLDYVYQEEGVGLTIAELAATACENVNLRLQKSRPDPAKLNALFSALANIDLEASLRLRQLSTSLLQTMFMIVQNNASKWSTSQITQALWANALLSLRDGQYTPFLTWQQVHALLTIIESDVMGNDSLLTEKIAKQLFQVYAANYNNRRHFPQNLLSLMRNFLEQFKAQTHGSDFEDRIENVFNVVTGKLKNFYAYVPWQANLRFDNPIMHFGAETDILFYNPETKVQLAIQVDGRKYHSFPAFFTGNPRLNQKTKFRNYCFTLAECKQIEIRDDKDAEYIANIESILKDHVVYPMHQVLVLKQLSALMDTMREISKEIEVQQNKFQDIEMLLISEEKSIELTNMLNILRERLLKLSDPQSSTDLISLLQELDMLEQEVRSKNKNQLDLAFTQLQKLPVQASDAVKMIADAEVFIKQFQTEVIKVQSQVSVLGTDIKMLETELADQKSMRAESRKSRPSHEKNLREARERYDALKKIIDKLEKKSTLTQAEFNICARYMGTDMVDEDSPVSTKKSDKRKMKKKFNTKRENIDNALWELAREIEKHEKVMQQHDALDQKISIMMDALEEMNKQWSPLDQRLDFLKYCLVNSRLITQPIEDLKSKMIEVLGSLQSFQAPTEGFGDLAQVLTHQISKVGIKIEALEKRCQKPTVSLKQIEQQLASIQINDENAPPNPPVKTKCYVPTLAQAKKRHFGTQNVANCKVEANGTVRMEYRVKNQH